jgi:predicted PurR-regulated permease PerM
MRLLERLHLPRGIAALLMILVLFAALAGLGTILSGPAATWAQKLPEEYSQIAGSAERP